MIIDLITNLIILLGIIFSPIITAFWYAHHFCISKKQEKYPRSNPNHWSWQIVESFTSKE